MSARSAWARAKASSSRACSRAVAARRSFSIATPFTCSDAAWCRSEIESPSRELRRMNRWTKGHPSNRTPGGRDSGRRSRATSTWRSSANSNAVRASGRSPVGCWVHWSRGRRNAAASRFAAMAPTSKLRSARSAAGLAASARRQGRAAVAMAARSSEPMIRGSVRSVALHLDSMHRSAPMSRSADALA